MTLSIVVAMAKNGAIGKGNALLWHISEDLKYFKALTMGAPIIMGRKTYESIGRPLPGRDNIILTRDPSYKVEGCECFTSLEEACRRHCAEDEIFIIGGGEIYKRSIDEADKLYVTEVDGEYEADTFFPKIGDEWQGISRTSYDRGDKFDKPFAFVVYVRKNG